MKRFARTTVLHLPDDWREGRSLWQPSHGSRQDFDAPSPAQWKQLWQNRTALRLCWMEFSPSRQVSAAVTVVARTNTSTLLKAAVGSTRIS
jgi:hypothetical protein